jgi:hypothetical protein
MRKQYYNSLDNFAKRLEKRVQKRIDDSIKEKNDIYDRDPSKMRNGLNDFGAFQMYNPRTDSYANFGWDSGSTTVAP